MSKYNLRLVDIITAISFFILVYFILTRIFGHSATDLAIAFSSFFMLGGLLYALNREVGEFKSSTVHSFSRLKDDMGGVKTDLEDIKDRLNGVEDDTSEIKRDVLDIKQDILDVKGMLNRK